MATNKEIAREFVAEYLSQRPEFIDMVEYADHEYPYDEEGEEVSYGEIWDEVHALMDTVEQRYADLEN